MFGKDQLNPPKERFDHSASGVGEGDGDDAGDDAGKRDDARLAALRFRFEGCAGDSAVAFLLDMFLKAIVVEKLTTPKVVVFGIDVVVLGASVVVFDEFDKFFDGGGALVFVTVLPFGIGASVLPLTSGLSAILVTLAGKGSLRVQGHRVGHGIVSLTFV